MKLVGSGGQQRRDFMFDASGTITTGGTAQLILPERKSTSFLQIQNLSTGSLLVEFGSARATCTITNGVVTAVTVTNGGFGFTKAPFIVFYGGGNQDAFSPRIANTAFIGVGLVDYPSPGHPAVAQCNIAGGAVTSVTILDGGSGYVVAPQVFIANNQNDPVGAALPSATVGVLLGASGGSIFFNGTTCTTDQISVFGATAGQAYSCKWMQ